MKTYLSRETYRSAKKFTSRIAELKAFIYARQLMISEAHGVQKSLSEARSRVQADYSRVQATLAEAEAVLPKPETSLADAEAVLADAQYVLSKAQYVLSDAKTTLADAEAVLAEEAQYVCLKAEDMLSLSEKLYHEFLEETAAGLDKELSTVQETLGEKEINIKPRFGICRKIVFNDIRIEVHRNRPSFRFVDANDHVLGESYKPEQVLTIIEMLKAAVERGDSEFDFPSAVELRRIV